MHGIISEMNGITDSDSPVFFDLDDFKSIQMVISMTNNTTKTVLRDGKILYESYGSKPKAVDSGLPASE